MAKIKNNQWQDHYSQKAKKENFAARSVYKLQEIQKKHHLIKKGNKILDLGCAPGSWMQYAAEITGDKGLVVGVDIKPPSIQMPANVRYIRADVLHLDEATVESMGNAYHLVMSDMAPSTTGHKQTDAARSFLLCETALYLSDKLLRPGGAFVCKIFQGSSFDAFLKSVRQAFNAAKICKPRSSRKASKEVYIIGTGKK